MYVGEYSERVLSKLEILKNKDPQRFAQADKKIKQILSGGQQFKQLRYGLKGMQRVHIGPFVLMFRPDFEKKIIYFDDFDHHDKVYER